MYLTTIDASIFWFAQVLTSTLRHEPPSVLFETRSELHATRSRLSVNTYSTSLLAKLLMEGVIVIPGQTDRL
jgi:hypothetical protein